MRKRRFVITMEEAELVSAALLLICTEMRKDLNNLSPREIVQLSSAENLKKRLDSYQWWVE